MGVRRPSGDEGGAGKQHPVRLRHPLVRQHASSLRQIQQGHRFRRRLGKSKALFTMILDACIQVSTDSFV